MGAELANSHPPVTLKAWEAARCLMSISRPCPSLGITLPPSQRLQGSWAWGLHTPCVDLKGLLQPPALLGGGMFLTNDSWPNQPLLLMSHVATSAS